MPDRRHARRTPAPVPNGTHLSPKHAARDALERGTPETLRVDSHGLLVLFKLTACLNHQRKSSSAWPTQDWLIRHTGLSERTIRRTLVRLRDEGLIRIYRADDRIRSNEYVLEVAEWCRRAGVEYRGIREPQQRELGPMLADVSARR